MAQGAGGPPQKPRQERHNLIPSLVSGSLQAGLLNPWDRALYLSVTERQAFLTASNFRLPYLGFSQSVLQRTVSGGFYFYLQGVVDTHLSPLLRDELHCSSTSIAMATGLVAGTLNGMALNQLATVKYHMWNHSKPTTTFAKTARHMWQNGGAGPFFKGITVTGMRDAVFGVIYEVLRTSLRTKYFEDHPVMCNVGAALVATVASSPWNYARNMKYGTPAHQQPPSTLRSLQHLMHSACKRPTLGQQLKYLQERLRIGWGSARVAVGMALGQYAFEKCQQLLSTSAA